MNRKIKLTICCLLVRQGLGHHGCSVRISMGNSSEDAAATVRLGKQVGWRAIRPWRSRSPRARLASRPERRLFMYRDDTNTYPQRTAIVTMLDEPRVKHEASNERCWGSVITALQHTLRPSLH